MARAKSLGSTGVSPVGPTEHGQDARATAAPTATIEQLLTSPGVAMGTVAYMSPEQARGEELDARTDLFSFGAVLYEMATGRTAFSGSTTATIFDAILNRAPAPPSRLNPELPPHLEQIISNALEKDRQLRYQTASDLLAELRRLKRNLESGRSGAVSAAFPAVTPQPEPTRKARTSPRTVALVGVAVVVVAVLAILLRPAPAPPKVVSFAQITNDGKPKYTLTIGVLPMPFTFARWALHRRHARPAKCNALRL